MKKHWSMGLWRSSSCIILRLKAFWT